MNGSKKIDAFVRKMERALPVNGDRERQDILRETRSHLMERAHAGRLDEALQELGPPEAYAALFDTPADAKRTPVTIPVGRVTLRLAFAALAVVLLIPCLMVIVMEVLDPTGFGLWVSRDDGFFVLGKNVTTNPRISDVAGHLMIPVGALLSLVFGYAVFASVRSALSGIDRA